MTYRFKRNMVYLCLGYFAGGCMVLILSGCSMPLRKPEPYEQRTASVDRDTNYDWDAKKRENAAWWRCLDNHRSDEC